MNNLQADRAHWITSTEELDQWLAGTSTSPLAVDTEFERVSTFFPIPGLVQLGLGDCFCLVDPEIAEASKVFRSILSDPGIPKLFYAMSEDLELFRQWLDIRPAGVVDLQIGAGLAGAGFSVGYAKLVETLFGVSLDKSATRSDWISRPLSVEQEQYALEDVRFLLPLYRWVIGKLEEKHLVSALVEESERFASDLYAQDNPQTHYLKLRGGWSLTQAQQEILQRLTQWREQESRDRNRPRNRVLPDQILIALAETQPAGKGGLQGVKGMPPVVVRRYGDHLLELIHRESNMELDGFQQIRPPLTRAQQQRYKHLKQVFVKAAHEKEVPIELLAPRKRLEAMVQAGFSPEDPLLQGWRGALVAPLIDDIKAALAP